MKTIQLLPVILVLIVTQIKGQEYIDNFGTPDIADLEMTSYAFDNSAEAVVLHDYGKSFFFHDENGFNISFNRYSKIKIFSKAGLEYGEITIPLYVENNKMEKVYDIEAYTYNLEDGAMKVSRLNPDNIFTEQVNEYWQVAKFVMPDIKEGSVIEFKYNIESPYLVNLWDWEFQKRIPVVYSEYTVKLVPFYQYIYIFQGGNKFDVYESYEDRHSLANQFAGAKYYDMVYKFGMKNVPAFKDEKYITSINDYIIKIDFQLSGIQRTDGVVIEYLTTWPELIKELSKTTEFGLYMKRHSRNANDILNQINLRSKSQLEKAKVIYSYITLNYSWNGLRSKFASQTPKEFIKNMSGNSADINLFLVSMLNAADIEATPVLISTRDHGKIYKKYPFEKFLNYVIVHTKIDNQDYLIDATESLCPFGMLPSRAINETGLLANEDREDWITIHDNTNSEICDTLQIRFNKTCDSVFAAHTMYASGHFALEYRGRYFNDQSSFHNDFLNEEMTVSDDIRVYHETDIQEPFKWDMRIKMPVELIGDKVLVHPFNGLVMTENPLKLPYRSYPVDLTYKQARKLVAYIDIPEGYQYLEQDEEALIDNKAAKIDYHVENMGNKLKIVAVYDLKKSVYSGTEYFDLKSSFSSIVESFGKGVVFVKQQEL